MSSTNRPKKDGDDTIRNKDDFYVTPTWIIRDFLKEFYLDNPNFNPRVIIDPCSGGDSQNEMPYVEVLKSQYKTSRILTYDIRDDSKAMFKTDYLTDKCQFAPDLIMSNPPFLLAEDFIKKCLTDLTGNGILIFLLRINFFGSQKRSQFFKDYMPNYCYVSSKRPSFCKGATDSTEYAHFVWIKDGTKPKWCQTRVI